MSDENGNGKPRIVTNEPGERAMRRPLSRGEAVKFVTSAALAMGEKIYKEIAEEHERVFAEQARQFTALLDAQQAEINALREKLDAHIAEHIALKPQ